jgi:predicted anti-sigma-YlaC factor YlaD
VISADLDGELGAADAARIELHLGGCLSCQQWRESAYLATRLTRVGDALPPADFVERAIAAVQEDVRRRRARRHWLIFARAVVGAGLLQVLATVPLLVLARRQPAGHGHVQLLGVIELAIGTGFFLGALVVLWKEREQSGLEVVRSMSTASLSSSPGVVASEEVA